MADPNLVPGSTSGRDVIRVLDLLHDVEIDTWVAGGWGVDALLGVQSRDHRDLDLLIPHERTIAAYETLRSAGFVLITDWFPVRFEMVDQERSVVDVHPIRRLELGGAELEQLDGAPWVYGAEALEGVGVIAGRTMRCLSVEEQVRCHLGYKPTSIDIADMDRLSAAYAIDLPAPYR